MLLLSGGTTSPIKRTCGKFGLLPLALSSLLPSSHPFPAALPSAGERKQPQGKALNSHLSTAQGNPGSGPALSDLSLSKIKARQKLSPFSLLPKARNPIKIQSTSFQGEIYTGGRGRCGYLMIVLGLFIKYLISPFLLSLHSTNPLPNTCTRAELSRSRRKQVINHRAIDSNHAREWETHGRAF